MNSRTESLGKVKRRSPKHPAPLQQQRCYLRRNLRRMANWALLVIAAMFCGAFACSLVIAWVFA